MSEGLRISERLVLTETVQDRPEDNHAGLTISTTCIFVVGILAGSGFLALPKAVADAGLITGLVFLVGFCIACMYTSTILSRVWVLLIDRGLIPGQGIIRHPYPAMGKAVMGKFGKYLVTGAINFSNFGTVVVYILLASGNIEILIAPYTDFSFCYICIIVAAGLTPLTWLGSPKDFWGTALAATLATGTASILILANIFIDRPSYPTVQHSDVTFVSLFTAFGTMGFSYGGHPVFPSVMADMKNPKNFGKSVFIGYILVLLIYLPSSVAGYAVYGGHVTPNILNTVSSGPLKTIATILMTSHLLFGIIIIMNPVSQEVEHLLNIPSDFTWKRAITRTLMMISALFVAESVPHFSAILALVGGSTVTLLAFILPSLFYLKLGAVKPGLTDEWEPIYIPLHEKILNIEIMLIGILAGIAATYSAVSDLATSSFNLPCYINIRKASE